MKKYHLLFVILFSLSLFLTLSAQDNLVDQVKKHLIEKDNIFDGRYPEYTVNGVYKYREKVNWFSGFIGGELWNLYDLTGEEELKKRALKHADVLIPFADIDYTHDMGFIFLPTLVKAYQHTGETKYRDAAITAAYMLAKRFNKKGNFIRAWGKLGSKKKAGLMIIDTMMNLELLFWAAKETGDYNLYDIAYKHAIVCMNEHVRKDFSSYHVVEFDHDTGEIIKKFTHQGIKNESTWARGEAWGIYGFALAYKYTGDERFLNVSKKMADYFLKHLPKDLVPYWDLTLSGENVSRDASAAAITVSGMYLLSKQLKVMNEVLKFRKFANDISISLLKNYTFLNSNRDREEGLLIHTVYNHNKNWGVDESYPCGDYYFTEVLKRYYEQNKAISSTGKRTRLLLNDEWFYLEDNIKNIDKLYLTDKDWVSVTLPHTWNKFDVVDSEPGYRRDGSWYQKRINLRVVDRNKLYKLYFEGANITTEVYVNGQKAGQHIGGYVGFSINITNFLKTGENLIMVRVDNSINKEIIPSQLSDFFIYGGITRDVWMDIVPHTHINRLHVSTPLVNNEFAETEYETVIESDLSREVILKCELYSPSGSMVTTKEDKVSLKKGRNNFKIDLPKTNEPVLWDVDSPNLYILKLSLFKNKELVDSLSVRFGYRWFEFKEHGPFYLNGRRLLLRGTHRHEDFAGLGSALSNERHRKDIEEIKEMGANFVRLAHYPQDPEVYKACDELGVLVWDELPWCRGGVGDAEWKKNTTQLLKEQINQNYNHPSIIMWSVGNEVFWLPEFKNGGNIDSLRNFTIELNNIAHKLDKGRVTSIRKFYEGSDIVDVFSPSIWSGWYSGVYESYQKAIDNAIKKYPRFFHAEYGGSSHLGRHTENPITGDGIINPDEWSEAVNQVKVKNIARIGDWSESYIVNLFDWHLKVSEQSKHLTGNAQWAFRDFGTPLRPENAIPYVNQKGLLDREGTRKDAYYVFKSYWNDDDKFCYIQSHTWLERSGPKGQSKTVRVYSNCPEVELVFNNKKMGIKKKDITKFPANGLVWNVKFNEGKNKIIANGYDGNQLKTSDTVIVNYSFVKNKKPVRLKLSSERLKNGNYLITSIATDKNGNRCIDYNERVYFSVEGKGQLLENYGVPGKSSIIEMANGKATIEFKAIPFEKAIIEIRNQNFKGEYLEISIE